MKIKHSGVSENLGHAPPQNLSFRTEENVNCIFIIVITVPEVIAAYVQII